MKHEYDLNFFCEHCRMPMYLEHDCTDLAECSTSTTIRWKARERIRVDAAASASRAAIASNEFDERPLPPNLTYGDLRRALGVDRWPIQR